MQEGYKNYSDLVLIFLWVRVRDYIICITIALYLRFVEEFVGVYIVIVGVVGLGVVGASEVVLGLRGFIHCIYIISQVISWYC